MAAMSYLVALAQRIVGADPAIRPLLPTVYQSAIHGGATRGVGDAGDTDVAPHVAQQGVASDFDGPAVEEAGGRPALGRVPFARGEPPLPTPAAAARGAAQVAPRTALQAATRPDRLLPAQLGATTVREAAPPGDRLELRTPAPPPAEAVRPDPVRVAIRPRDVRPAPEARNTADSTALRTRDQVRALASEPAAPQEPTIHVRIGRIDVRAAPTSAPAAPAPSRPAVKRTSLADYLSADSLRGGSGGQP